MKQIEKEFAALVKEQKSTIYSICYMFSKDKDEIDDLFQETLIHLWQGFEKFRNESKIETWVYRVTMNTCISMDRKEKRRGERIPLAVDNDRLIRDVLIKKKKSVDKNIWFVGICGLITITIGNLTWSSWGVSSWFLIGTTVFVLVCILMTIIPHNWVKKEDIQSGNLLVAAKQVRRLRKLYKDWEIISIILAIIWATWLFIEFSAAIENKQILYLLIGASVVGGIIGGIIGLKVSRNIVHTLDEMIQEIEEMPDLDGEAER